MTEPVALVSRRFFRRWRSDYGALIQDALTDQVLVDLVRGLVRIRFQLTARLVQLGHVVGAP